MSTATAAKGLEGVIAASTEMSYVNGTDGILEYVGIPIADLAENSSFEETVFLLWNRRLPKQEELDAFVAAIRAEYALSEGIKDFIRSTPKSASPMAVLRTGVSMMSFFDDDPDNLDPDALRDKGVRILAKMPTILAYFDSHRKGRDFVEPDPNLGLAANFMYMLNGEKPTETMEQALDICLILHADHGLNASTFTSRVICSTMSDLYSTITGAIGALKGPLHGGANERVMKTLKEIGSVDKVDAFVEGKLARKEKIMGFGHRVYKTRDPRAVFLKNLAKDLADQTGNMDLYEISTRIADVMEAKVGSRGIYPNVDFYSATTYHCIGLETDLFTPMFAVSRVSGWTGHVIEQLVDNRIMRPRAEYVGPHNAPYTPMNERG
ncbi:MAG: citrate/2-methylcitrate synthase [Phycisphaerales bacterium]